MKPGEPVEITQLISIDAKHEKELDLVIKAIQRQGARAHWSRSGKWFKVSAQLTHTEIAAVEQELNEQEEKGS